MYLKIQNLPHRRAEQSPLEQGGTSETSGFPVDVQVGVTYPHITALGSGGLGSAACPPSPPSRRLVDEHKVRAALRPNAATERHRGSTSSLRPRSCSRVGSRAGVTSLICPLVSFTHHETLSHWVFLPQCGIEAGTQT